jgi:hypothetical protein
MVEYGNTLGNEAAENPSRGTATTPGTSTSTPDYSASPTSSSDGVVATDTLAIPGLMSKNINKTFGRADDYIEMHIYNTEDTLLYSNTDFKQYILPENNINAPLTDHLIINPKEILHSLGFITGKYKVKFLVLKNKIFKSNNKTAERPFRITQISPSRREIKCIGSNIKNDVFDSAVSRFISDLESSAYFKEFSLNFGQDLVIPCVNIVLNKTPRKHEFFVKTLAPIPSAIIERGSFKVVEEISDPFYVNVDLGSPELIDNTVSLSGPNFSIDIRQNNSVPSGFKNYNDLLSYDITSSYHHLLSKLEGDGINIDIKYDYIRPVSGGITPERTFHFENFVHFSSATERLKNFEYKLKSIEEFDDELDNIYNITGDTSSSFHILEDKDNINDKRQEIIKNFDGYERFLYYTTGSNLYTWPKYTESKPYLLYSVTSSEAKSWLGEERSNFPNYGGQLLSASLYDKQNNYNLNRIIPNHITDDLNNSLYVSFVDMIGQHFDHIWTYIKEISNIYNNHNNRGISKDLVYHQLRSLGIDTFDQFENSSLIEYILGEGSSGSAFFSPDHYYNYSTDHPSSSLGVGLAVSASENIVTSSFESSIPKEDITKEIWKRLYHNSPYLLKTKGTERGLKALMSCYGVPSTILNVKEYGGSTTALGIFKDLDISDTYKTFTYEKASLALKGDSGTGGHFLKTNWSSSYGTGAHVFTENQEVNKTIEFRIKPYRTDAQQHLLSLSGSTDNQTGFHYPNRDCHLILDPYIGNDISSSKDSTSYGRLQFYQGEDYINQTQYFPIFNGDFWNIFIHASPNASNKLDIKFGSYKANFIKNVHYYVTSSTNFGQSYGFKRCWGERASSAIGGNGAKFAYFGGIPANNDSEYDKFDSLKYSGSLQEVRFHFGELLSHNTLRKHALEPFMYSGNTVSSSYENLIYRAPLGSNDKESKQSFIPKDIHYFGTATSNMSTEEWEEIVEYHYLPTPDTVGISTTSEKVRIDNGTIDENILSPYVKGETSTLDRQPQDFEDLGVFFSPTEEMNEDILYTLGSFRLDDYIGSPLPSAQTASKYEDLKTIKDIYYQKVQNRYNYWDYIKQVQYIDHTLFKMIENFVPARANLKTGLLIEPTFLERNKIARSLPILEDLQTMVEGSHQTLNADLGTIHFMRSSSAKDFGQEGIYDNIKGQHDPGSYVIYHSNNSFVTSSNGERKELGTNTTIDIYDNYMDPQLKDHNYENNHAAQAPIKPYSGSYTYDSWRLEGYIAHESSILLGNAIGGRKSNKYYQYPQYNATTSSMYIIPGDD